MLRGRLLRAFLVLAIAAVPGAIAGSAQAAIGGSAGCQPSALSEPFAAYGDTTTYELVPGGDFQGTLGGWSVSGGAAPTSDGLSLPEGAIATSPAACVNLTHPTVRFYARAATPRAVLDVAAVLDTPAGVVATPIGEVAPTADLAPSAQLAVRVPLLGASTDGTLIALRFEARVGTAQIDDVYVDPWRSG